MKVYIVTEYGGSYDDSWDHILGVFTDKARAEEVKETYWAKVQKRLRQVQKALKKYEKNPSWDETPEESQKWGNLNSECYDLEDIAGVKIDEYPLDEFLGGYYNPENAM